MPSIGSYAIVLVVVAATTFVTLFGIRRFAFRIGAVVRPDSRHVHERPTPTLGGVAMLLGVLAGMFTAWCMGSFDAVFTGSTEPLGLVLAAIVIAVVDDLCDYDKQLFSYNLFTKWGIGDKEKNNGVLIMLKPKTPTEKGEVFIETGYGMEGVLPDAIAS